MNLDFVTRLLKSSKAQTAFLGVLTTGMVLFNVSADVQTKVLSFTAAVVALATAVILGTAYEDGQEKSAGGGGGAEQKAGGPGSGTAAVALVLLMAMGLGGCGPVTPKRQILVTVDMSTDVINGVSDAYVAHVITYDDLKALQPGIDAVITFQQLAQVALASGDAAQIQTTLQNLHDATLQLLAAKVAAQQARQKPTPGTVPAGGSSDGRSIGGGRLGRAGGNPGDAALSGGPGQRRPDARRDHGGDGPREGRGRSVSWTLVGGAHGDGRMKERDEPALVQN